MPRKRDLRPSFFTNEYLAVLPFEARLLFAGLWTIADRRGRLKDLPPLIKGALFPYDEIDVDRLLQMLADSEDRFIIRYIVDGKRYIQIAKFEKNQHIHKDEAESTIPAPDEHPPTMVEKPPLIDEGTEEAPTQHPPNTPSSLVASSLVASSLERGRNARARAIPPESGDETPAEPKKSVQKTKYADFVSMTNDEYSSLVAKVGVDGAARCVEILDNYKGANGKRYVSDYRAILTWVLGRFREEQGQGGEKRNAGYSRNTGGSVAGTGKLPKYGTVIT